TGKTSGAGAFHRWYHNALSVPKPPTWAYELNNKMHANLYTSYTREWQLSQNNFSVYLAVRSELAIGTKDIYAQPEFIAHFGRRQAMKSSMAYKRIGSIEKEVFFSIRIGYRFLSHNALLEGHVFGDNSIFLVNPKNKYFYGGFDIKHRDKKNDFWFGYCFNSAETKQTKLHKYIILSYARSF
ncbi:MAG: lipid A deacylase LpxR family protein, partial [Flavobacteriaceae bacterium]|nr:lipid A deacylase LpxR family protein [Flavobacteriaceae bacterium]